MKTQKAINDGKTRTSRPFAGQDIYGGCWKIVLTTRKLTLCPRCRKMLGLPSNKSAGLRDVFSLMQATDVRTLIREFMLAFKFDTKFDVQVKVFNPNGNLRWFRIVGIKYYRRWGTTGQIVGTIEDTTQLVNEERVSLAVVDHELRSPLTIIKLNVQLLMNVLSSGADNYPVRILSNVHLHIEGMTRLIGEYLCTTLNDCRQPELNHSVFYLNELIDIVVNEMKALHKNHRFQYRSEAEIPVNADKYKIVQVLINYLTNAVNFSPHRSTIVVVASINDGFAEVSVKDEGIGIPTGQNEQLFKKFYRSDINSVRQKNSKGLGLYLVKKIVDGHKGLVWAEAGENKGSVFYFSLPVCYLENKMAARAG